MAEPTEIELVFEPEEEGGYHVYAPDLPGLHTQGADFDEAMANAEEALALYVEGLREDGEPLEFGVIRRKVALPRKPATAGRLRRAVDPRVGA